MILLLLTALRFPKVFSFLCPAYQASNTYAARTNVVQCYIYACVGATLVISSCPSSGGTCSGDNDPESRLYDSNNVQVAANDDYCNFCSQISYTVPLISGCSNYRLDQGCYDNDSCEGQFSVVGGVASPTQTPTISPTILTDVPTVTPSLSPSQVPTISPSLPPSQVTTISPSVTQAPTLLPTVV